MRAFVVACVAAIVIAVIGGAVLNTLQESADKAFSTPLCDLAPKGRL